MTICQLYVIHKFFCCNAILGHTFSKFLITLVGQKLRGRAGKKTDEKTTTHPSAYLNSVNPVLHVLFSNMLSHFRLYISIIRPFNTIQTNTDIL